jgi:hypothetical protein
MALEKPFDSFSTSTSAWQYNFFYWSEEIHCWYFHRPFEGIRLCKSQDIARKIAALDIRGLALELIKNYLSET